MGIGYRPLTDRCAEVLSKSDVVLASNRLHEVFMRYEEFPLFEKKLKIINNVGETMEFIRENLGASSIVLLASGDPLFFGIGRMAVREFGPDSVEIIPDLSSIQLAFSAIKETWDDAFLISLHGGPDPNKRRRLNYGLSDLPSLLRLHRKIGILTDRENSPVAIAKALGRGEGSQAGNEGPEDMIYVCERLGYPDEKITSGTPAEIALGSFSDPNVVIIKMTGWVEEKSSGNNSTTGFGLTEDEIAHTRGLITKDEVRAVSIHKLRLPDEGVLWDIGAGSGSISIESARICPRLRVYAIEKNDLRLSDILTNIASFGLRNLEAVKGEAPDILKDMPVPDRVFIGGGGDRLPDIMRAVIGKMEKGIIVLNAISLETLNTAMLIMSDSGLDPEVSQISVSRSKVVSGQRHMTALNPIFVVRGVKK